MSLLPPPRIYEILEKIISFPTVTGDTAAQDACLSYMEGILIHSNLTVMRHYSNGIPSLVASTQDGRHSTVLLQSHIDVVPAPKDLFTVTRVDGKLKGRGTFDMKFAAACFLAAAETLAADNKSLDYAIMFTCDEESGSKNGTPYLLEKENYRADVCLLPDGSINWDIEKRAKGAWFVSVKAEGQTAHGSRPWEGDNAACKLLDFLQAARQLVPATPEDYFHPTITVSEFQGGTAINQVPSSATATLDVRFPDSASKKQLETQLYELAAKHEVELSTHACLEASHIDLSLPLIELWRQTVCETLGRKSVGSCDSLGASDAQHFIKHDIPVIVTRPRGGNPHADDEWINEADVYDFYRCVVAYLRVAALAPLDK